MSYKKEYGARYREKNRAKLREKARKRREAMTLEQKAEAALKVKVWRLTRK